LLYIDKILSEYKFSDFFLISIDPSSDRLNVGPSWILPTVAKHKPVLHWVEGESHISIVKYTKVLENRVIILFV
jgi:hypothetical protein